MADAFGVPAEQRDAFVQFARNTSTAFLNEPVPSAQPAPTQSEPALPLLQTKLFSPIARPNLVLRPRLVALLKDGLSRPLTLIASSAGFGKTTLAAHIATFDELARTVWLSLDGDDNDLTRFLTNFIHACQRLQPGVGELVLASLRAPPARSRAKFFVANIGTKSPQRGMVRTACPTHRSRATCAGRARC